MHSQIGTTLKYILGGSYVQLKSVKTCCSRSRFRIPAPTRNLKSSKVSIYMILAGRPFQRQTVDGKKDPLLALMDNILAGSIDGVLCLLHSSQSLNEGSHNHVLAALK